MEITKDTVLKAWKDDAYAQSLPADVRKALPARPTAQDGSALSDAQLEEAAGGISPVTAAVIVAGTGAVGAGVGYGGAELID